MREDIVRYLIGNASDGYYTKEEAQSIYKVYNELYLDDCLVNSAMSLNMHEAICKYIYDKEVSESK